MRKKYKNFPGQITLKEYWEDLKRFMAQEHYEWAKGLVHVFVIRGNGPGFEEEELEAVALFALAKAIETFDYSRKIKFRTYASKLIHNELMSHCRSYVKNSIGTISLEDMRERGEEVPIQDMASQMIDASDLFRGINTECMSNNGRLGIIALDCKMKGTRMKELSDIIGVDVPKLYRCINTAREELKSLLDKKAA